MECTWGAARGETILCDNEIKWIIAYVCDKCGNKNILDMCTHHMTKWTVKQDELRCAGCNGTCNGTLSWGIKSIQTGNITRKINNTNL